MLTVRLQEKGGDGAPWAVLEEEAGQVVASAFCQGNQEISLVAKAGEEEKLREAWLALLPVYFQRPQATEALLTLLPTEEVALQAALSVGFAPLAVTEDQITLRLTQEMWGQKHRERLLHQITDAMCEYESGCPQRIHHLLKVHAYARQIAIAQQLSDNTRFVVEVAALVHDIGIRQALETEGHCTAALQETLGGPAGEALLTLLGLPAPVVRRVKFLIEHHHHTENVQGIDWQILLEADFLVNMIEGHASDEGIDAFCAKVFRTEEGKRLLGWTRPAQGEPS